MIERESKGALTDQFGYGEISFFVAETFSVERKEVDGGEVRSGANSMFFELDHDSVSRYFS
jgi:hypothetical protein